LSLVIQLRSITKQYKENQPIFSNFSLDITQGDSLAITGASGVGKSTLLNMLGLLDRPTSGEIAVCGERVCYDQPSHVAKLRNQTIGFVFQQPLLISYLTVIENVKIGFQYRNAKSKSHHEEAMQMLQKLHLSELSNRHPYQLSGGQQQRVALARALVLKPKILLADEPTAALDSVTKTKIIEELMQFKKLFNFALVLVTHDLDIAKYCQNQLILGV